MKYNFEDFLKVDIFKKYKGLGLKKFPAYCVNRDDLERGTPYRPDSSTSGTKYGYVRRIPGCNDDDDDRFVKTSPMGDVCFGGLFSKDLHFYYRDIILTVYVPYRWFMFERDVDGDGFSDWRNVKKTRAWFNFIFNLYPFLLDKIEFHMRFLPVEGRKKKLNTLVAYTMDFYNAQYHASRHVMMMSRALLQFPDTVDRWYYLVERGVHPTFALWIAHRLFWFNHKDAFMQDSARFGGYVYFPAVVNLEKIFTDDTSKIVPMDLTNSVVGCKENEILSVFAGSFGMKDFLERMKGANKSYGKSKIFGVTFNTVSYSLSKEHRKVENVVNTALKIQSEYLK